MDGLGPRPEEPAEEKGKRMEGDKRGCGARRVRGGGPRRGGSRRERCADLVVDFPGTLCHLDQLVHRGTGHIYWSMRDGLCPQSSRRERVVSIFARGAGG